MKVRICFCPASLEWIRKHLMKSARHKFRLMVQQGIATKAGFPSLARNPKRRKSKKRRTAKQRAATRRLIAFNKRRRN